MAKIPETSALGALASLAADARRLLKADEKTLDRKVGRILLALAAAGAGSRIDVLDAFDRVAQKYLGPGIVTGKAAFGATRTIDLVTRVDPSSDQDFEGRLLRLVKRYQGRPPSDSRDENLAGQFAVIIEGRWPSLPHDRTFDRLLAKVQREGIKGKPEEVVRTIARAVVDSKKHRNWFNAGIVKDARNREV